MKDWILRWLGMGPPSSKDFSDLAAVTIERLAAAQQAHISDLRVLIDKGHEREAQLAAMIKMALDHQFYRPTISGGTGQNKIEPVISGEAMTDVTVFDEEEDAALMAEQQAELTKLIDEQNEKGAHKVEA